MRSGKYLQRNRIIIKTELPAIVRIDGQFAGESGKKALVISAKAQNSYYIEVVYLACSNMSLASAAVRLSTEQLSFECRFAEITKLSPDTYAVSFIPVRHADSGVFKPIQQLMFKQFGLDHTATLHSDGIYYVELECDDCIIKKHIDLPLSDVSIAAVSLNGHSTVCLQGQIFTGKNYALFLGFDGEDYRVLGEYRCAGYTVEGNNLTVTVPYGDMAQHSDKIFFTYDGRQLSEAKREKLTGKKLAKLSDRLIPYAFLEAVRSENAAEALALLSPESFGGAEFIQLQNYFGDFYDITQNYYGGEYSDYVAIKVKLDASFYALKYYSFVIKNGLIDNIIAI